jgi:hypothetical protein
VGQQWWSGLSSYHCPILTYVYPGTLLLLLSCAADFLGDSIFGDICCIFVGLTIVLGIRLSGVKVSSNFWPNG